MKLKNLPFLLILTLFPALNGFSQNYQDTINAARRASNNGEYRKALKYYKSAEPITPKEVDLSQEMGQTAYKAGDFETAERCFDQLASTSKSKDERSEHLTNGGIASMKAEKFADAEGKFKDALRNDPGNERARQLLMEAKRLKKEQEEQAKKKEDKGSKGDDGNNEDSDQGKPDNKKSEKAKDGDKDKKPSDKNSDKESDSKEGTLEDKQTERKLDELSRQEMDAKRRMNGTNGSNPSKKATKDW